jgi:hypothetical protein
MKAETKEKLKYEEEKEALNELFFAKFEAQWAEIGYFRKLSRTISADEADKLTLWWLFCFAAEMGIGIGQTKEEFMDAVGAAYEESVSEDEPIELEGGDEGEDEEEADEALPISIPPVSIASLDPAKDAIRSLIENPLGTTKED